MQQVKEYGIFLCNKEYGKLMNINYGIIFMFIWLDKQKYYKKFQ